MWFLLYLHKSNPTLLNIGVAEYKYEFLKAYNYNPLNQQILGDFKIYFSPTIGGWGAIHTFNQQRQKNGSVEALYWRYSSFTTRGQVFSGACSTYAVAIDFYEHLVRCQVIFHVLV